MVVDTWEEAKVKFEQQKEKAYDSVDEATKKAEVRFQPVAAAGADSFNRLRITRSDTRQQQTAQRQKLRLKPLMPKLSERLANSQEMLPHV